ncbi:betaine--homocysteine S-methyltransferase 1-like [Pollicipes pollicipes]|uniref:betaine--homocysteine S-methyltransferase 1-like n=1 Tax=Pollicipes pollicipes TaxID=41117 RepID=UPI0018859DEE|nr:betaine--homocysteine S-methyltransferase 1-like [Pollicipes pollicipes]
MESLVLTRFESRAFAREAYDEGVRYIGGCCYFRATHIRAMAEELSKERGGVVPEASHKGGWGADLATHANLDVSKRSSRHFWMNAKPASVGESANEYLANWKDALTN